MPSWVAYNSQSIKIMNYKLLLLIICGVCTLQLSGCATGVDLDHPEQAANEPVNSAPPTKPSKPIKPIEREPGKYSKSNSTDAISVQRERITQEDLSPIRIQSINADQVMEVRLANDLWERIRKGYAMPDLDTDLVHDREQWYASKGEYLSRMTERSSKYLYYIVEELENRKMPSELALLPFIESSFNPQAVSSAKASGMWQFMPKTGKNYDLKQNLVK